MRKRLDGLDFLKFICCFMVICLHIPFTRAVSGIITPLSRIAVPIFFMITGYFYSATSETKKEKKQLLKIARIFFWANTLYLIYSCSVNLIKGESVAKDFTLINFCKFIFLNESPFGGHLWYLGAILYVLIIIYFFEKRYSRDKLYFLIPFLLLFDLVFGKYSLLFIRKEIPFIFVRNFLFVGLPYFLIGDIIFKRRITIARKHLLILICIFASTTLIERYLLNTFNLNVTRDHYISTSFLAVFTFMLACHYGNNPHSKIYKKCCSIGANLSLDIYIIHPIIISALAIIVQLIDSQTINTLYVHTAPFVVFVVSIVISKFKMALCRK